VDVDALVSITYEELFLQETKRKSKGKTPLEYVKPDLDKGYQGLFLGGQALEENFTFALQ